MRQEVGDTQQVQDTQSQKTAAERSSPPALLHGPIEKTTSPQEERRFYFDPEAIRDLFPTHKWRNEQVKISFSEGQDTDCHCFKKFAGKTVRFNLIYTLFNTDYYRCNVRIVKIDNTYSATDISKQM